MVVVLVKAVVVVRLDSKIFRKEMPLSGELVES